MLPSRLLIALPALALLIDTGAGRANEAQPCDTIEIQYALAANLELSDTPLGQGNGIYPIGPGMTVIRYDARDGVPAGPGKMVAYSMTERLKISAKTLFWNTHVATDAVTTVGHDACGVVATGILSGRTLEWTSDVLAARTDGTVTCEGSFCGKSGAPPPGTSPLHVPPHDTRFRPWAFGPDMKTFTMANTWISRTESPKQTAHIALSGREVRRTCVKVPACTTHGQ